MTMMSTSSPPSSSAAMGVHDSSNNVRDLDLTLLEGSDLSQLAETIRNCPSVESVDISCPNTSSSRSNQLSSWNTQEVQHLFETIGSLPNLRRIQFKFLGGGDQDNTIPLSLFTALLNQQPAAVTSSTPSSTPFTPRTQQLQQQLESLRLVLVGPISCQEQDIAAFSQALRRQEKLRDVRLSSCYLAHESLQNDSSCMDPIFQALSTLPVLETVNVKAANRGHLGRLHADAVGALCHSTSLKNLSLDNFALDHSHTTTISNALANANTNTTNNNATTGGVEDLYLNLSGATTPLDPTLLSECLRTNQSLRRLQLRLSNQKTVGDFLMRAASALTENTTLKEFGIHGGIRISEDIERAFCSMLECNCVLESLVLPSTHTGGWRERIDMLLQLNGRGRQRLLQQSESIPRIEWIQLFANASNDLSFVYYYMRVVGPLLCKEGLAS